MTDIDETPDSNPPLPADAPPAAPPPEISLSLDEFCRRFSSTDRRVTLLGAFHFEMRRQRRLTATESEYRAAFAAFATAPVYH